MFVYVILPVAVLFTLLYVFILGPNQQKLDKERAECQAKGGVLVVPRSGPSICVKELK